METKTKKKPSGSEATQTASPRSAASSTKPSADNQPSNGPHQNSESSHASSSTKDKSPSSEDHRDHTSHDDRSNNREDRGYESQNYNRGGYRDNDSENSGYAREFGAYDRQQQQDMEFEAYERGYQEGSQAASRWHNQRRFADQQRSGRNTYGNSYGEPFRDRFQRNAIESPYAESGGFGGRYRSEDPYNSNERYARDEMREGYNYDQSSPENSYRDEYQRGFDSYGGGNRGGSRRRSPSYYDERSGYSRDHQEEAGDPSFENRDLYRESFRRPSQGNARFGQGSKWGNIREERESRRGDYPRYNHRD